MHLASLCRLSDLVSLCRLSVQALLFAPARQESFALAALAMPMGRPEARFGKRLPHRVSG